VATGRVKWFNENKGFGFIEDEKGNDVFVHYTAVKSSDNKILPEGVEVEFVLKETDRGPQAEEVRLLEEVVEL
jgi:CspA family cold shock protein